MKNNNVYYLQLAYKKSLISFLNNNIPVGAVITDKKNIFSINNNTNSRKKDVFEHAEIKCLNDIRKYNINKSDFYLYSTLVCCPACLGNIYMNNIKNVYFGCENNNIEYNEMCYKLLDKRIKCFYLQNKCSYILSAFFKVRRKLFPGK